MNPKQLLPYCPGILTALSAPALAYIHPLLFVAAITMGAVIMLTTRSLLRKIEIAEIRERSLEEEVCRAQKICSIDELSGGIAHEINNPLGIIAQEAQWMQHMLGLGSSAELKEIDECRDSLREITAQVDRCKEIVKKLLNLARELEPVIQRVDINELLTNMTGLVERETQKRNIIITRQLDPNLPVIRTDPPLLRQVVLNLLVNASQAIEENGDIDVITKMVNGEEIRIIIKDNGCGIPAENLNRIFTPFFSTKQQGKGTGLGLAICRGIIERLGGHIHVSSKPGVFTEFTITLPTEYPTRRC